MPIGFYALPLIGNAGVLGNSSVGGKQKLFVEAWQADATVAFEILNRNRGGGWVAIIHQGKHDVHSLFLAGKIANSARSCMACRVYVLGDKLHSVPILMVMPDPAIRCLRVALLTICRRSIFVCIACVWKGRRILGDAREIWKPLTVEGDAGVRMLFPREVLVADRGPRRDRDGVRACGPSRSSACLGQAAGRSEPPPPATGRQSDRPAGEAAECVVVGVELLRGIAVERWCQTRRV